MPFYQRIAFKQNQVSKDEETGKKLKMIDAREIVAIINMFDVGELQQICASYAGVFLQGEKCLIPIWKTLSDTENSGNIIPGIFDLYDAIECEFAAAYNDATGGRYGRKKYSG